MSVERLQKIILMSLRRLGDQSVDLLEINISCPNVKEGGIAFGQDPKAVEGDHQRSAALRKTADHHEAESKRNRYYSNGKGS